MPTATALFLDSAHPGSWNMAVDEALLLTAAQHQQATLRFYQWARPTLSLGYFQSQADRGAYGSEVDVIRRASGGGAILHHHELTYSFAAPVADRLAADVESLYYAFHETLIATLATFDVPAQLATATPDQPFLCFQRRSTGDVICHAAKIAGSAQRRHQGAVLQHGSILLQQSQHAPELPGILELTGVRLSPEQLAQAWSPRLAERLDIARERSELSSAQEELAQRIEREKFGATAWTARR
jgi:lipoate-protein ligase A